MSDFGGRFSISPLPLPVLLANVEAALPDCGLRFDGALRPMMRDTWDFPMAVGDYSITVASLTEVAELATSWWGICITCIPNARMGTDRIDAFERYQLSVFRSPEGPWMMHCYESNAAEAHRIAGDTVPSISALQLALCEAGGFDVSIYNENDCMWELVPTLRTVEIAIDRVAFGPTTSDLSVVISSKVLDYARARRLAGPRADEVKVSTSGYVSFSTLEARGHAKH
jgi:hypothetical protein